MERYRAMCVWVGVCGYMCVRGVDGVVGMCGALKRWEGFSTQSVVPSPRLLKIRKTDARGRQGGCEVPMCSEQPDVHTRRRRSITAR